MTTIIDKLEKAQQRRVPAFDAGDRVRVHFQVIEGTRRRTQVFEGVVIKRQGSGIRETFTVRKQSFGVGVERTFPVHSTKIEKIEVAARGEVRRAKLYYLRDRVGKRARVRERQWTPQEQAKTDAEAAGAYDDEGAQDEAELVAPTVDETGESTTADAANESSAPDEAATDDKSEGKADDESASETPDAADDKAVDAAADADAAPAADGEDADGEDADAADADGEDSNA